MIQFVIEKEDVENAIKNLLTGKPQVQTKYIIIQTAKPKEIDFE